MITDYLKYLYEADIYETVLYYVAESRWKRLLAAGKLTKSQLLRIQRYKGAPDPLYVKQLLKKGKVTQAGEYLKKRGIIKSAKQWLAGVERGTQNILKRYGAKVKHSLPAGTARSPKQLKIRGTKQAHALPYKKRPSIHVASGSKVTKKQRGDWFLTKRHEADEVRTAKKLMKYSKIAGSERASQVFSHVSPEVLRKEKELVNTAKALYGRHGGGREFAKLRKSSKEYDLLKRHNLFTKKEIRKYEKSRIKSMETNAKDARKLAPVVAREIKKSKKEFGKLTATAKRIEKDITKMKELQSKCKTPKCNQEIGEHINRLTNQLRHIGDIKEKLRINYATAKEKWEIIKKYIL